MSGRDDLALIALGSNLGDRAAYLRSAVELLVASPDVEVLAESRLLETDPVGGPEQGHFLNGAVLVRTSLSPRGLLDLLKRIEGELGRTPGGERWGPRVADLDLLLHGAHVVDDPDLVVPHPRMHERRFVLEPAAEVAADMVHPRSGRTVAELLARLDAHVVPHGQAERERETRCPS